MLRLSCFLFILAGAACGSSSLAPGPCDTVPPNPACNIDCDSAGPNTCPIGFYCTQENKCYAQCVLGGNQCGDGFACTADGQCVPEDQLPGGPGGGNCPRVSFTAKPTIPSILLLIDRSGSMRKAFDGTTRWNAVRQALVNPNTGVVSQLASRVFFGSMIFQNIDVDNCPQLFSTPRVLANAAAIRAALQTEPDQRSGTPTAKSLEAATASFQASPAPAGSPKLIVLATDGRPNPCDNPTDGVLDNENTENAAGAAYAAGIKVIPLSVGSETDDVHLQKVANRGSGVQTGQPNAPFYKANNSAGLKAAFDAIIGGVVSCDLTVTGSISEQQAMGGDVQLNGRKLTYVTDWELVGSSTIRLLGAACTELKTAAMPKVDGTFPCGTVIE